ncbi:MAG: hypothetical protein HRT98_02620 [Mycoplasmatales bacterium]|nr:hypothetical protein [Mycoplasmatales bacterium]
MKKTKKLGTLLIGTTALAIIPVMTQFTNNAKQNTTNKNHINITPLNSQFNSVQPYAMNFGFALMDNNKEMLKKFAQININNFDKSLKLLTARQIAAKINTEASIDLLGIHLNLVHDTNYGKLSYKFQATGYSDGRIIVKAQAFGEGNSLTGNTYGGNLKTIQWYTDREVTLRIANAKNEAALKALNRALNFGVQIPVISLHKQSLLTSTSTNGYIEFELKHYDPRKMKISLVQGSSGTLGKVYNNKVKVSGLRNNQWAQIKIELLSSNDVWRDNTAKPLLSQKRILIQNYKGLTKPTITPSTIKKPTTTKTKDGKAEFVLANFDPHQEIVSLKPGAKGTLRVVGNKAIVSGLGNGEKAEIVVTPIKSQRWSDGTQDAINIVSQTLSSNYKGLTKPTVTSSSIEKPTTITTKDGKVEFVLVNFVPNKEVVSLKPGSKGTLKVVGNKAIVSGLAIGEKAEIVVTPIKTERWTDGTQDAINVVSQTLSSNYKGLTKPTVTSGSIKKPTTTTTKDGKVEFVLVNFTPNKEVVSLKPGSKGTLKVVGNKAIVSGLGNGEKAEIVITPIKTERWTDGTQDAIVTSSQALISNYRGLTKPTITPATTKVPTTITTKDGKVEFVLANFNPNKEVVSLKPGSKGTLKVVGNKAIVSGLATGEKAEIVITPIKTERWSDGTQDSIIASSKALISNYKGLKKPVIKSITSKKPSRPSSKDGEVEFVLANFNPNKEVVSLKPGSKGVLKVIGNKAIVSGLATGEKAEIVVTPIKTERWSDGTQSDIQSTSNNLVHLKIKQKKKNKTTLSGIAIAGIVIGSIFGLLFILSIPFIIKRKPNKRKNKNKDDNDDFMNKLNSIKNQH